MVHCVVVVVYRNANTENGQLTHETKQMNLQGHQLAEHSNGSLFLAVVQAQLAHKTLLTTPADLV